MRKTLIILAASGAAVAAGLAYVRRRLQAGYERDVLTPEAWEARGPLHAAANSASSDRGDESSQP